MNWAIGMVRRCMDRMQDTSTCFFISNTSNPSNFQPDAIHIVRSLDTLLDFPFHHGFHLFSIYEVSGVCSSAGGFPFKMSASPFGTSL